MILPVATRRDRDVTPLCRVYFESCTVDAPHGVAEQLHVVTHFGGDKSGTCTLEALAFSLGLASGHPSSFPLARCPALAWVRFDQFPDVSPSYLVSVAASMLLAAGAWAAARHTPRSTI